MRYIHNSFLDYRGPNDDVRFPLPPLLTTNGSLRRRASSMEDDRGRVERVIDGEIMDVVNDFSLLELELWMSDDLSNVVDT